MPQDTTLADVADAVSELGASITEKVGTLERRIGDIEQGRSERSGYRPDDVLLPNTRRAAPDILGRSDSFAEWATEHSGSTLRADNAAEFSLGRTLAAMVTGQRSQLTDLETRALAEGTDSAGGFLIPEPLAGHVIDLLRPQAQVLAAGAQVVPMSVDQLSIARLTGPNTAYWRAENSAVTESNQTFDRVTFQARTCAILMRLSMELFEDLSSVSYGTIQSEIVQRLGLALDAAALHGTGSGSEPTGIRNQSGVNLVSLGAAGATPTSFDFLVDAIAAVRDSNGEPNAAIYSSRTQTTLDKLADTTGQPLRAPDSVAALTKFVSNQIPDDLDSADAANSDCSEAYVADWSTVLIGLRPSLGIRVKVLDQRYADQMQIGILAYLRADVQLAHPELTAVVSGIRP